MDAVINSFLLVAASEMGDKTQLLAFVLACRFRKPWPVFWGIFVATTLNHFLAALVGSTVAQWLPEQYLRWVLASIFIVFAFWILIPDKEGDAKEHGHWGAFLTTVVSFFIAEMGDKTQLATVALAARYQDIVLVTIGTTLGMMLSNGLAVFFGDKITERISMKWIRIFSCVLFIAFGVGLLLGVGY
ncbi:Sulfite exporter TauE/SafE [compost metagenome]